MFTREHLDELHRLSEEVSRAEFVASEQMRTAKDRFADRVHKDVPRIDGGKVELSEKQMWEEVFLLGLGCESAKILKKHHPDVFKAYERQGELAKEFEQKCFEYLGVNSSRMTISAYLKMTEELFELMLAERGIATKSPIQNPKE